MSKNWSFLSLKDDQSLVLLGGSWSAVKNDWKPTSAAEVPPGGYINASYIRRPVYTLNARCYAAEYTVQPDFIATQGPLNGTVADFLVMAYEQKSTVIVMLCRCIEKDQQKCAQYWPEGVNQREVYVSGNRSVEVNKMSEEAFNNGFIRKLTILPTGEKEPWPVTQIHLITWPDFGTIDAATLYNLVCLHAGMLSTCRPAMACGPSIVHCSAGVGRTGTFLAASYLLDHLRNRPAYVDVFGTVLALRKFRVDLVQTASQLQLLYDFVDYCIQKENLVAKEPGLAPSQPLSDPMEHKNLEQKTPKAETEYMNLPKPPSNAQQPPPRPLSEEEYMNLPKPMPSAQPQPPRPPVPRQPANLPDTVQQQPPPVLENEYANIKPDTQRRHTPPPPIPKRTDLPQA